MLIAPHFLAEICASKIFLEKELVIHHTNGGLGGAQKRMNLFHPATTVIQQVIICCTKCVFIKIYSFSFFQNFVPPALTATSFPTQCANNQLMEGRRPVRKTIHALRNVMPESFVPPIICVNQEKNLKVMSIVYSK
jgi:hypothetical protein